MNTDNTMLFMHIPKTGGVSLNDIIQRQYKSEFFRGRFKNHYIANRELNKLSQKELNNIKCISGHFGFGIHSYFKKSFYITMLRHPVERLISTYYFICNNSQHFLHHKYKNYSFEDFLNTDITRVRNLQTRYILGFAEYNSKILNKSDLKIAQKNIIDRFSFIGITELFPQSVFLMGKKFGWKNIYCSKKNITRNRPSQKQIAGELIEKIIQKNKIDMQLYHFSLNILKNKINKLNNNQKSELNNFVNQQSSKEDL